jgi:hypothetical protein
MQLLKTETMAVVNVRAETDANYIFWKRYWLIDSPAPSDRDAVWTDSRG